MMVDFFNKLIDNYVSKIIITLFGIVGTIVTIYAFLQEQKVDLRYEVISNTNVLDFNADLNKLEVIYDSTNIKQTKENLRIFTIRIINNGNQNILKDFFDDNELLGIKVSQGKIIEIPQLIQSSNDYIKRNLKVFSLQKDRIYFSKIIIESGEFFVVKLLVLHKKDEMPIIQSIGKIAGQKEIKVINEINIKEEVSFLSKIYSGTFWVQCLRLISYFLFGVLIIVLVIFVIIRIDNYKNKIKRKKTIKSFKSLENYQYKRLDDAIFERYLKEGTDSFKKMQKFVANESRLNKIYKDLTDKLKNKSIIHEKVGDRAYFMSDSNDFMLINEMLNDGIIFREQDKLVVNQVMKDTLDKLIVFLNEKKELEHN